MGAGMKGNIGEANENNKAAMPTLRNKTVSASNGKILLLTGHILSGSVRAEDATGSSCLTSAGLKGFFEGPQKVQTRRRSQHDVTCRPQGGLLVRGRNKKIP